MAPAAALIPALIGAGGTVASSVIAGKSAKSAMKPSSEEAGYLQRQSALADLLRGQAETTFNTGMPAVTSAMSYYDTLARGNRAKMQEQLAPSIAQITEQYRGAEGSIRRNVRGAQRQQQLGELSRDRASKLALLTTGQQTSANDAMARLGEGLLGHSSGSAGRAGGILDSMTGNAANRRAYGQQVGRETGASMGGMVADILKQNQNKKWGGGGGTAPGQPGGYWPGVQPLPAGDFRVPVPSYLR
jgi:hypothetical protein